MKELEQMFFIYYFFPPVELREDSELFPDRFNPPISIQEKYSLDSMIEMLQG